MNTSSRTRSILKLLFLFSVSLIVILAILIPLYFKSHSFVTVVESLVQKRLDRPVSIGTLSIGKGNRVIIENLTVQEGSRDGLIITVPRIEIGMSLSGLLKRRIHDLILEKPEITFDLSRTENRESESKTLSIPFSLKKGKVSEAQVVFIMDSGRAVKMTSVNVSIDEERAGETQIKARAHLNQSMAALSLDAVVDTKKLRVKKGAVSITEINFEDLSALSVLPDFKGMKMKGTLNLGIEAEGVQETEVKWLVNLLIRDFAVESKQLNIDLNNRDLKLTANGMIQPGKDRLEIESLRTEAAHLAPFILKGTIENTSSGDPDIDLTVSGLQVPLKEVKKIVSGPLMDMINAVASDFSLALDMSLKGKARSPHLAGIARVKDGEFKKLNLMASSVQAQLPFEYTGNILLLNKALVTAERISQGNIHQGSGFSSELKTVELTLPRLEISGQRISGELNRLSIQGATVYEKGKEYFKEKNLSLTGKVEGDISNKLINLKKMVFKSDSIGHAHAEASLDMQGPLTIDASVSLGRLDIAPMARNLFDQGMKRHGIDLSGTGKADISFSTVIPEQGEIRISGISDLALKNGGFIAREGETACEGIDSNVRGAFDFTLPLNTINFKISSESTGFELLAGRFYGSFSDKVLNINAEGKYTLHDDSLQIKKSSLGLSGMGMISLSGEISRLSEKPVWEVAIGLSNISNREAYNFFIRETFQQQAPSLSTFEISGTTDLNVLVKGSAKQMTARGRMDISGMNIERDRGMHAKGINVSLPLDISYPDTAPRGTVKEFGVVSIKEISWKKVRLEDTEFFPAIWGNALMFKDDIVLPLLKGEIVLARPVYKEILSSKRELRLAIGIDNIDLFEVSNMLDIPAFNGNLSGRIPTMRLIGESLHTEGEIELQLFGGSMKVTGLSMENVFTPIVSITSSVKFDGINLDMLTDTFDFGHISGVIKGNIDDLEIVRGQAQQFTASLQSYKVKGIKQTISVDALKKISILGTGSSGSILDRGIYQFFKKYRYEKIGFKAHLKNDNLFLRGVESGGNSRQYLVKGGLLPPKVNVITYSQNVSFREMIKRLKRIGQIENRGKE